MSTYTDPQQAIDAGGRALQSLNRFPWYDPVKDELQRVEIPAPAKPVAHHYYFSPVTDSLIYCGALALLAVVLALLVLMIVRAAGLRKASRSRSAALAIGEAQQIEALPFPLARASLSLLDRARNLYRAGNYAAAMVYLFSHELVQLDRHQVVRLAKGKTNRQYLREVGESRALGQLVGQSLVAFEDVFFGHHDIDRRRFEACWSRLPEFESLLAQGPPSTA